jgi:hypothetical protein
VEELESIKAKLPVYCVSRMIILAVRGHNQNFQKVFNYYLEMTEGESYIWADKQCAINIRTKLEEKYSLQFCS